jgi:hypothetical protein
VTNRNVDMEIPDDDLRKLRSIAEDKNLSFDQLVAEILSAFLTDEGIPPHVT